MMQQKISQTQSQRLEQRLSPQQMHALKLLQMPIIDLEIEINNEIMENPILEIDDGVSDNEEEILGDIENEEDVSLDDNTAKKDDTNTHSDDEYKHDEQNINFDDESREVDWDKIIEEEDYDFYQSDCDYMNERVSSEENDETNFERKNKVPIFLHEHLINQLSSHFVDTQEKKIAEFIIWLISPNGMLTDEQGDFLVKTEDIVNLIDEKKVCGDEKVDEFLIDGIIEQIKKMDPPGCGSRNFRESLMAQLEYHGKENSIEYEILEKYFDELKSKKIIDIARKSDRPVKIVSEAVNAIGLLKPYPADNYMANEKIADKIMPDLILKIEKDDGKDVIFVELNETNIPSLKISNTYRRVMKTSKDKNTREYIKNKLDSANFFINAINQRKRTMVNVMEAIAEYQFDFFVKGSDYLKPMILNDIAEKVGMHPATVSRVVNSKYVDTPAGIFLLKDFFSTAIEKSNDSGDSLISNKTVMEKIRYLIDNEDKKRPLSDDKIATILSTTESIKIARRTVTKYRENLKIATARFRKSL